MRERTIAKRLCLALLAFVPGMVPSEAAAQQTGLDADEVRRIVSHGPWPPPWRPDPSNRVSGNAQAAALGRRLFFDARMSPSGRVACSSCHRPERGWSDGRPRGIGLETSRRNTPSLYDVRISRWLGWGGGGDSLWMQSLRPLLDPGEMGSSARHVKEHIAGHPELSAAYASVFGRTVAATEDKTALVDAAKALAAYQETIVSPRTAFDAFRDAMTAGDEAAAARYPVAARRGAQLFVGAAQCSVCHSGPAFSDGGFHATGVVVARLAGSRTFGKDEGRRADLAVLLASPYNLSGRFNDDPERRAFWRPGELARESTPIGALRTPALRNVARTAPYMHDGSRRTLRDAVRHHPRGGARINASQTTDLLAFLRTLTAP